MLPYHDRLLICTGGTTATIYYLKERTWTSFSAGSDFAPIKWGSLPTKFLLFIR